MPARAWSARERASGNSELSRKTWLITSLSPGKGLKMSKHSVTAGDIAGAPSLRIGWSLGSDAQDARLRRHPAHLPLGTFQRFKIARSEGWHGANLCKDRADRRR
jgi:hypothetical protein